MSLNTLDGLLWAAGSLLNAALLLILLVRRRYRILPWFTAWMSFDLLFSVVLFTLNRAGLPRTYTVTYWSGAGLDLLFQVAVVIEIGRVVLRRNGQWVHGARRRFVVMGSGATGLALALSFAVQPMAKSSLSLWTMRGTLFTAVLICLLFTAVVAASQQLGLGWRSYAMREGYGLTLWALTSFVTETLHGYFGSERHFKTLDYVEMAVWVGSLLYWSVAFLLPESVPPAAPPSKKHYDALKKSATIQAS